MIISGILKRLHISHEMAVVMAVLVVVSEHPPMI
jgi:hypothetical protein